MAWLLHRSQAQVDITTLLSTKTLFLCIWIVYCCVDQRGVASTNPGNFEGKTTEPEYSLTAIIEFTATVYEDPTRRNNVETSLEEETYTTGNSSFEAITPGSLNSSGSNLPDDVTTMSNTPMMDKQTMTTVQMSSGSQNTPDKQTMTTVQMSTTTDQGGSQSTPDKQTMTTVQISTTADQLQGGSQSTPDKQMGTTIQISTTADLGGSQSTPDKHMVTTVPISTTADLGGYQSTPDKQMVTTVPISTTADLGDNSQSPGYTKSSIEPDTYNYFFTNPDTNTAAFGPSDDSKEKMFSKEFVYCLIGVVALLGALFIICLIVKLSKCCLKRSRRPKRKHSWKRAKTTISDTYFTVMSGRRPPLPPRNAKQIHNDDTEEPYHIPVLMQHTDFKNPKLETLVYQNNEGSSNREVPGNYVTNDLKSSREDLNSTSMIIYKVENIYETAFHNNGFARDEEEEPISKNEHADDQESRAVKRYISMRCRPDEQGEFQRNSKCSEDSAKTEIDGGYVLDNFINHLLKSTDDSLEPRSPEYNTYDSVPNHAFNSFQFPKSESKIISDAQSDKEKSFRNEDFQDLQSPDYNTLQFRELPEESRTNTDCLSKNNDVTQTALNRDVADGKQISTVNGPGFETHTVNELENVYTLDPTQSTDNTELSEHSKELAKKMLLQRGVSWSI